MYSSPQQQTRFLFTAKSADCLKLDLNYKMQKRGEIKLLNAKILKLKNKCRALREESKNDRQTLSNLMNTTIHLETKTNEGIRACKRVSDELIDNHQVFDSSNTSLVEIMQQDSESKLQINSQIQKLIEVQKDVVSSEQILQSLQLDKFLNDKNTICNDPTERSITVSLKSERNGQDQFLQRKKMISVHTEAQSECSQSLKRANTISFSPKKKGRLYRRSSLQSSYSNKIQKPYIHPHGENTFMKYVYAIIWAVVLTIILFKLVLF